MNKVDLSAAIIFKNEIRCLERCLKSLQHLRERLSVQIVMADTGSTDGSRAIAEQYADAVFDFPWVNDFSAARNAVLERCTGAWALVLDCDEWLDDIEELVAFLRSENDEYCSAGAIQRNYMAPELDRYTDMLVYRLLNMAAKPHMRAQSMKTRFTGEKARSAKRAHARFFITTVTSCSTTARRRGKRSVHATFFCCAENWQAHRTISDVYWSS